MPIEFFEKEYSKMQADYNRIYRLHNTPDLKSQCNVIIAMVTMGRLCEEIVRTPAGTLNPKDKVRFIQTRNWLHNQFQQIENDIRRYHDRKNKLKDRYHGRCVLPLQQSLPGYPAHGEQRV